MSFFGFSCLLFAKAGYCATAEGAILARVRISLKSAIATDDRGTRGWASSPTSNRKNEAQFCRACRYDGALQNRNPAVVVSCRISSTGTIRSECRCYRHLPLYFLLRHFDFHSPTRIFAFCDVSYSNQKRLLGHKARSEVYEAERLGTGSAAPSTDSFACENCRWEVAHL